MKVAILHDYLNQFGGAERVLQSLVELFPQADLYTLLYDEEKTLGLFRGNIKKTSFLDYPWLRQHHRLFIPLMPLASRWLKSLESYDLIVSSTAGYAKGFNINAPFHISYCHSPLRYAWELDYLDTLPFTPWLFPRTLIKPVAHWLRRWDKKASQNVNVFIANSKYIAQKINTYYGREATIIHPPVDLEKFYYESASYKLKAKSYYLMAGRLLYYKGFDLGIKALKILKKPLKIVGIGPESRELKSLARSSELIEFIPFVDDEQLRYLYNQARALIFPQIEDFGLVAAEAQACGLPVIAYNKGGAQEIIKDGQTGLLFNQQTVESLVSAIKEFEVKRFDRQEVARQAKRFSKDKFKKEFLNTLRQYGYSY